MSACLQLFCFLDLKKGDGLIFRSAFGKMTSLKRIIVYLGHLFQGTFSDVKMYFQAVSGSALCVVIPAESLSFTCQSVFIFLYFLLSSNAV